LDEINPKHLNGCITLHFNKESKELESISPMLPATSIQELINQLQSARNAIDHLLKDLVDKNLPKN